MPSVNTDVTYSGSVASTILDQETPICCCHCKTLTPVPPEIFEVSVPIPPSQIEFSKASMVTTGSATITTAATSLPSGSQPLPGELITTLYHVVLGTAVDGE